MKKHQFKPFDQVLVRLNHRLHKYMEQPDIWSAATFSHTQNARDGRIVYNANSLLWDECIPYNENTAHLVGTNKPYEEPEPTVWCVKNLNTQIHHQFTQKQFESFIKDISNSTDEHVYYIHRSNN